MGKYAIHRGPGRVVCRVPYVVFQRVVHIVVEVGHRFFLQHQVYHKSRYGVFQRGHAVAIGFSQLSFFHHFQRAHRVDIGNEMAGLQLFPIFQFHSADAFSLKFKTHRL